MDNENLPEYYCPMIAILMSTRVRFSVMCFPHQGDIGGELGVEADNYT